ncbi:hypothetical protein AHAS_Ahas03G0111100 [Arachis hypogaea]
MRTNQKKKKNQNHPQSHSLRHSQLHLTHRTSQRFPLRHSHLSRSQHGYRRSSLVTLLAGSSAASPHRQCLLASASSAPVPPPFVSSRPPWLRRASAVSTSASSLVSVQHLPSACTLHDKQRVIGGAVAGYYKENERVRSSCTNGIKGKTSSFVGCGGHITMLPFSANNHYLITIVRWSMVNSETAALEEPAAMEARCRQKSTLSLARGTIRAQTSNTGIGPRDFGSRSDIDGQNVPQGSPLNKSSRKIVKPPKWIARYPTFIALALIGCALVFSLVTFLKGGPASVLAAISKSGFTAAFTLIFVSEIGDKTFFIAALLAMQYEKGLVLLGSMGALALMTILSVVIGRIFQSVPAQFQTTLPIGEYAAVTLLLFFGLKAIKDAWDLPSNGVKNGGNGNSELNEFAEAEELVKEKVSKRLSNPFEVIWKSFSLVFFAEWGDRSMLATIALGAAQSPWGVASGAIGGHLLATSIAIVGGALLANYISEKLVGYLGGGLFLIFAVATFFGVF